MLYRTTIAAAMVAAAQPPPDLRYFNQPKVRSGQLCEERTALGFPSPHEAQRSGGEGSGVGGRVAHSRRQSTSHYLGCRVFHDDKQRNADSLPPTPTLPTARKCSRGEGAHRVRSTDNDNLK